MNEEVSSLMRQVGMKYAVKAYADLCNDANLMSSISVDDALMSLLVAERDGRDCARQRLLMGQAKIPIMAEMSEISYDEARGPEFARAMSVVRTMSWVRTGNNLCLLGGSGSGKTFLISALAREAVRHGYPTLFTGARDIAALLAERRAQGAAAYQSERTKLKKKALIVLDDLCLTHMDEAEIQGLFDLLNDRAGIKSVAVLSQKDPVRWNEEMGPSAVGEALVERIMANSITINLGTGSRRKTADIDALRGA